MQTEPDAEWVVMRRLAVRLTVIGSSRVGVWIYIFNS